jgi:hypothetical protein
MKDNGHCEKYSNLTSVAVDISKEFCAVKITHKYTSVWYIKK